jgi:DNA-binding NtrC family response regulator
MSIPCRILVVEPYDDLRDLLISALEPEGIVDAVSTVHEMHQKLTTDQHVVIVNMAVVSNRELAALDRAAAAGCVVVAIAEQANHFERLHRKDYEVLAKPFRIEALRALLRRVKDAAAAGRPP